MRLLGYIRVSRVGDREGESFRSPDQQREAITAYAKAQGHEVTWLDPDLDESGSKLDRPAMQAALALLREGKADGIIAARLDRLTRSVADLGRLLEQAKAEGWNLIAIDLGVDLSTSNGKLVAQLLGVVAEWELDRRREGFEISRADAIARSVHIGPVPAGYGKAEDRTLEPNEYAPAIEAAFELRARGGSWSQVAQLLTEAAVPTSRGATQWSLKAAEKVLRNEAYLGTVRSGKFRREEAHKPLVSRALFKAVEARRETRARTRGPSEGRLLSGLLYCASCGHRLTLDWLKRSNEPDGRYFFYRCRGDGCEARPSIAATKIEPYIEEVLRERLAAGDFTIETPMDDGAAEARAELAAVKHDLADWLATDIKVSAEAWQARTQVLEARVAAAQAALDEVEVAGLAEPLPSLEKYDALPIPLKRHVLEAFFAAAGLGRLAVRPGRGSDRRFVWLPEEAAAA